MILGNIVGKTSTLEFSFLVKHEVNKFDYVQVPFKDDYVLAQILEIEKSNATIAKCNIIGYRKDEKLKQLLSPLEPGCEVLKADESFIKEVLDLKEDRNSAFVGSLQRYNNLKVYLDLNKLLTKHVSILAKSGSGKSYVGGVLVEEILERDIPLLIIDPHGEYSSLRERNEDENLSYFGLKPRDYRDKVRIYSPNTTDNPECIPLRLSNFNLSSQEILHVLPAKLSNIQLGLLYSSLKDVTRIDFNQLILELELEENPAKYTLINTIKYLDKLNLFSDAPTSLQELVSPGKCSILNLRGVEQELQEVVVYKLVKDLFEERKKGNIPPFFLIIEESHNYCLTSDTNISTLNGLKPISKIKKSDLIFTFNFKNNLIEYNKPIKIFEEREEDVYAIKTLFGNKINSTKDHPFFTKRGFVYASGLKEASIPLEESYIVSKYLVIARLIGHIMGDGWLSSIQEVGFSGANEDLLKIKKDLEFLGFSSSKIVNRSSKSKISSLKYGILEVNGSGCSIHASRKCFEFFKGYGLPVGRKVLQPYLIPRFILNGSSKIKAEFLAALMGSDGYNLRIKKKNIYVVRLCFSKVDSLGDNGKEFAKQMISLLRDLDITATYWTIKGNLRKSDGLKTTKYIIDISNENKNIFNFVSKVGFRYCKKKEIMSKKVFYYYKHKLKVINEKENIRKKIWVMREKTKYGKIRLSKIFNIDPSLIRQWIYNFKYIKKSKSAGLGRLSFLDFKEWCSKYTNNLFIFDPIEEIKYIGRRKVYNFSVLNNNFIANNILTHNCPERSFGEAKSSRILRQVASEGRKFGLGLCVISQRPSRLDKSVISQCSTQIILKVTNPNDLRAIASSVEGLTYESEKEIKNLNVGTALITGVAELPLFVNIRPRMTKHGGEAVDMLNITNNSSEDKGELLQVIRQKTSKEDLILLGEEVNRKLIPCLYVQTNDCNLLINLNNGKLINNLEKGEGKDVIKKLDLSPQQKRVFDSALMLREFTAAELFSKSGVQFSEIYDIIHILLNKGYFVQEGSKYKLSNTFNFDFNEFNVYSKPDFYRVEGEKLKKNFNNYEIISFLNNFIKINNEKECWLEVYA